MDEIIDSFQDDISEIDRFRVYRWMASCHACGKSTPHVTYLISFKNMILRTIGEIPKLDNQLIEKYSFVEKRGRITSNVCIHCNSSHDGYSIFDEVIHHVAREDIDNSLENTLSNNDLPNVNYMKEQDKIEEGFENLKIEEILAMENVSGLLEIGWHFAEKEQYQKAHIILTHILELEPGEERALTTLADIHFHRKEYDRAIQIHEKLKADYNDTSLSETDWLQLYIGQELETSEIIIQEQGYLMDWNFLNVKNKNSDIYEIRIAEMGFEINHKNCKPLEYIQPLKDLVLKILERNQFKILACFHVMLDILELIPEEFIADGFYSTLQEAEELKENLCPLRIFCTKDDVEYIIEIKKFIGDEHDYSWY